MGLKVHYLRSTNRNFIVIFPTRREYIQPVTLSGTSTYANIFSSITSRNVYNSSFSPF